MYLTFIGPGESSTLQNLFSGKNSLIEGYSKANKYITILIQQMWDIYSKTSNTLFGKKY